MSSSTANSYAYNAIDILNQTISASNVNNSLAYAQLAGVVSINYNAVDQSVIGNDAVNLSNNPTAQALRDTYKADLVLLFSHEYYAAKGGTPDPSVIAHPNNGRAYAIVTQVGNSTVSLVAAHELSHLYGCNHEDMAYGLYYSKATIYNGGSHYYASLVASGPAVDNLNACRLLQYSNPNFGGGNDPSRNNTQVMSDNAGGVKNFRPEPNILSAYIDGPYSGIAYHMYTFEAITSCGSAPYSYQWRVSTDGFNYGSVLGTGEYFNTHLYHNGSHWHYIKLTVTSADNQTKESTRQVWVDDNNGGYRIGVAEAAVGENVEALFSEGIIYPNPVTTSASVNLELIEADKVLVTIHNVGGTTVARPISQRLEKGKHRLLVPFNKYNLSDGEYLIRVQSAQKTKTHKVIYRHETH